jgi:hypothetical protein
MVFAIGSIHHMTWGGADIWAFEIADDDDGDFITGDRFRFRETRSARVPDSDAPELEALWNSLPEASMTRCHNPNIGFEVRRNTTVELRAALCYKCSNMSLLTPAGSDFRTFDADGDAAIRLQALLYAALPYQDPFNFGETRAGFGNSGELRGRAVLFVPLGDGFWELLDVVPGGRSEVNESAWSNTYKARNAFTRWNISWIKPEDTRDFAARLFPGLDASVVWRDID